MRVPHRPWSCARPFKKPRASATRPACPATTSFNALAPRPSTSGVSASRLHAIQVVWHENSPADPTPLPLAQSKQDGSAAVQSGAASRQVICWIPDLLPLPSVAPVVRERAWLVPANHPALSRTTERCAGSGRRSGIQHKDLPRSGSCFLTPPPATPHEPAEPFHPRRVEPRLGASLRCALTSRILPAGCWRSACSSRRSAPALPWRPRAGAGRAGHAPRRRGPQPAAERRRGETRRNGLPRLGRLRARPRRGRLRCRGVDR